MTPSDLLIKVCEEQPESTETSTGSSRAISSSHHMMSALMPAPYSSSVPPSCSSATSLLMRPLLDLSGLGLHAVVICPGQPSAVPPPGFCSGGVELPVRIRAQIRVLGLTVEALQELHPLERGRPRPAPFPFRSRRGPWPAGAPWCPSALLPCPHPCLPCWVGTVAAG